ncbi:UDP-N-acetylglucosamine 2-epimerase [Bacteroidales bacterium Barb6XT]|nr:UDP-N-acetylglucosamine 2-epimerase [Bacteroidales bacterium Barb6XT]
MKIVTVIGARPQFVKAAMVSRAVKEHNRHGNRITELLLHTGQHYDENMSGIFFTDMQIPRPAWLLEGKYSLHGEMTGYMLTEIEKILLEAVPDYVLVYGDTNSTLAGALAAAKLHIPVVHVEAGLRSFNRRMPEETNRVLTDHLSSLLLCPTFSAVRHLAGEGIHEGVHHVGDVMYDAALLFGQLAEASPNIADRLQLKRKSFFLCTVHRAENTDNQERMSQILAALKETGTPSCPVVLPLHPRTRRCLESYGELSDLAKHPGIRLLDPLSFLDMVSLEKYAAMILTDSGGVQKEAYFHHTPCITLRDETEWTETVEAGWNQLAGCRTEEILRCLSLQTGGRKEIPEYGSGHAAEAILRLL